MRISARVVSTAGTVQEKCPAFAVSEMSPQVVPPSWDSSSRTLVTVPAVVQRTSKAEPEVSVSPPFGANTVSFAGAGGGVTEASKVSCRSKDTSLEVPLACFTSTATSLSPARKAVEDSEKVLTSLSAEGGDGGRGLGVGVGGGPVAGAGRGRRLVCCGETPRVFLKYAVLPSSWM